VRIERPADVALATFERVKQTRRHGPLRGVVRAELFEDDGRKVRTWLADDAELVTLHWCISKGDCAELPEGGSDQLDYPPMFEDEAQAVIAGLPNDATLHDWFRNAASFYTNPYRE
jgi:hypothetical protein